LCVAHPGPAPVLVEWDPNGSDSGALDAAAAGWAAAEGAPRPAAVAASGAPRPAAVARLRSRSLRVEVADDLLTGLRDLLGPDHVHLVRAT
jgi:hypothetical protein